MGNVIGRFFFSTTCDLGSMVRKRKKDYNLADNKKQKTAIAIEIVRQVHEQNPPGRFLTKDPSATRGDSCHWWIEIDETDAIAKTTQALREGAPEIRRKRNEAQQKE